jgi:hypothetical protein
MNYRSLPAVWFFMFTSYFAIGQAILEVNSFERFEEDIRLVGTAQFRDDFCRLTPAIPNQTGGCWYKREKVDLSSGFETEFEFRITESDPRYGGGDGFAFVIHNLDPEVLGAGKDGLGYEGRTQAVVIEFDTYDNNEGSKNHVNLSYYDETLGRFKRHATVHSINELSDGNSHFARVEYRDGFLTFFLDSYIFPVLSSKVDLSALIGADDKMGWMGFTSSTSLAFANHDLLKWTYKQKVAPPDIVEDKIKVNVKQKIEVASRKLKIKVWDNNKVDGDIVSIKSGNDWILSSYKLKKEPIEIDFTLTGFSSIITLYAHNIGTNPPNTCSIAIIDSKGSQEIVLNADFNTSEALEILYTGPSE